MSTVWGDYYPGTDRRNPSPYGSPVLESDPKRWLLIITAKGWRIATKPSCTGLDEGHGHYTDRDKGRNLWVGASWGHEISHAQLPGRLYYQTTILSIAADKLDLMAQASTFVTDCCCKLQPPATQRESKGHRFCHGQSLKELQPTSYCWRRSPRHLVQLPSVTKNNGSLAWRWPEGTELAPPHILLPLISPPSFIPGLQKGEERLGWDEVRNISTFWQRAS